MDRGERSLVFWTRGSGLTRRESLNRVYIVKIGHISTREHEVRQHLEVAGVCIPSYAFGRVDGVRQGSRESNQRLILMALFKQMLATFKQSNEYGRVKSAMNGSTVSNDRKIFRDFFERNRFEPLMMDQKILQEAVMFVNSLEGSAPFSVLNTLLIEDWSNHPAMKNVTLRGLVMPMARLNGQSMDNSSFEYLAQHTYEQVSKNPKLEGIILDFINENIGFYLGRPVFVDPYFEG